MNRYQHHISGSIETYWQCPAKWYYRYVQRIIAPPTPAMLIGTGTDESVTANLNNKIATGGLLDLDTCADAARDAINRHWDAEGVWLASEEDSEAVARGRAIDSAVAASCLHAKEVAPTIAATETHWRWALDFKGSQESLTGDVDILEGWPIRDTKVTRKAYAVDAADRSWQLTTYAFARTRLAPEAPAVIPVTLDVFVLGAKGPKYQVLRSSRGPADYQALWARIQATRAAIASGNFPPCSEKAWWCTPEWCFYYPTCRYVRHPESILT